MNPWQIIALTLAAVAKIINTVTGNNDKGK
jgi:hypothetical protein